jgi:hypothetical protein
METSSWTILEASRKDGEILAPYLSETHSIVSRANKIMA